MTGAKVPEGEQSFESLLAEMPRIAEAVKVLPEGLQAQAFEALMSELRSRETEKNPEHGSPKPTRRDGRRSRVKGPAQDSKSKRRTGGPSLVRDLDLSPKGQMSLADFVAEKQPKANHDRNVVSVYYLDEVLRLGIVTLDHVFTCYRDMRWREPGDLANSLSLTAVRKRFLDTANLDEIKLTPAGRNRVEQDLPRKTKRE